MVRPMAWLTRHRDTISLAIVGMGGFVFAAALARFYLFDIDDPYKCHALLNSGRWLDPQTPQNWQPPSCMLNTYKPQAAQSCFADRRIVMAGDSMVRETFWAMVRTLNSSLVPSKKEKHADIHVTLDKLRLDFYWDPYLNSTGVESVFNYPDDIPRPALAVLGTGLWYAKNLGANAFAEWKNMIDEITSFRQKLQGRGEAVADLFLMLPVLEPAWNRLSETRASITPETLAKMNSYLHELSTKKHANVAFSFQEMLSTGPPEVTRDAEGLHLVDSVTAAQAQILLNLQCNDRLDKKFPFSNTCCYKYPAPNYIQLAVFTIILVVLPILYHIHSQDRLKSFIPSESILHALIVFGLVLVYAFYTDRTQLFGKEQKQFSNEQFWFLVILTAIIGYLTAETAEKDQPFLSRDQTDEWKGWMQILILIYHYLGASKVTWIYNGIRVLVAMYLFMTGFGHTVFFYKKADYSFKRVVAVLVRLNVLNVVLAYTMDTDYLFYYFSPLVSFWFGVIWVTMWINHERNKEMGFLAVKFVISAIVVTVFTKTPGILEMVFSVLNAVARISWDAVEWRFRLSLDMWIVYIGMAIALLFVKANEMNFSASPQWLYTRNIVLGVSIVILPAFILFEATRPSKFVYNKWHPYISFLPILAFVVLRNASTKLRNTHSAGFAFIGRCSLETFILQFHIWLAGDTKGILVIVGPSQWRWVSFIFGTILFVFLSWKVASVTGTITSWIMGNQKKPATVAPVAPIALAPIAPAPAADGEKATENDVEKTESPVSPESQEPLLPPPVTSSRELSLNEKLIRVLGIYWEDLGFRTTAIILAFWFINLVQPLTITLTQIYP